MKLVYQDELGYIELTVDDGVKRQPTMAVSIDCTNYYKPKSPRENRGLFLCLFSPPIFSAFPGRSQRLKFAF